MNNNLIFGILFGILSLLGFVLLIFVIVKALSKFTKLSIASQVISGLITLISLVMILAGGFFALKNFTYRPPQKTESTQTLQNQIDKSKDKKKSYVQLISTNDYYTAPLDKLYSTYSKDGQSTIDTYTQGSEKTKAFLLRNVGRNIASDEGITSSKLKTVSGEVIDLKDKKERVLVFADDSEYSTQILTLFKNYQNQNENFQYVIIFPTLDGTKVTEYFQNNSLSIGSIDENLVVSIDSFPTEVNRSIYTLATSEYTVTDLPSYLAIDDQGVISFTGVGTIIKDDSLMSSWIRSSFGNSKLYNEIERGLDSTELSAGESSSNDSSKSTDSSSSEQSNSSTSATGEE